MTHADLGRQVKSLHPGAYDQHPDHVIGMAMARRFPGVYPVSGGMSAKRNLDSGTIPEAPKTLKLQLDQLAQGIRRVVFVARGAKLTINAAQYGARRLTLPSGDFYYTPAIKPQEIIAAVKNHELNEILGSATQGYGAPSKQDIQGPPEAVMSRTQDGTTVQGALTDKQHIPQAVSAAHAVTPPGGQVSVEPPANELQNRLSYKRPARGKKWPKPGGGIQPTIPSTGIPHQEI